MKIVIAIGAIAISLGACGRTKPPAIAAYCSEYDHLMYRRDHTDDFSAPRLLSAYDSWVDCIHLDALALAGGPDDANSVAKAVRSACESRTHAYVADLAKAAGPAPGQEHMVEWEGDIAENQARLVVVQSRASHCPPRRILK